MAICYWCPEPADSKEDLFPRWLDAAVEFPDGCMIGGMRLVSRHTGLPPKVTSTKRIATKLTAVSGICRSCNNGWMSRLEMEAKPLLTPLINGHSAVLSPEDQLVVARWACVKACAFEANPRRGAHGRFSTSSDRSALRRGSLPADMSVSLGAYDVAMTFAVVGPYGQGVGERGQPLTQWLTTFLLGHLVLQVFGRAGSSKDSVLASAPGGVRGRYGFSVWPPQLTAVSWPPPAIVTRAEVVEHCTGPYRGWVASVAEALQDPPPAPCEVCGVSHGQPTRTLPVPPRFDT